MNRVPYVSNDFIARPRRDRIYSDRRICDHHTRLYWTDHEAMYRESDVTADAIRLITPDGYEGRFDTRNPPIEFYFTMQFYATYPAIVNANEGDASTYQVLEILIREYATRYQNAPKPNDERMSQIIRELIRQVRLILNSRYEAALNHATYDTAHSLAFEGWDALSRGLLILFQLAASPLYDDQGFALPTQPEQIWWLTKLALQAMDAYVLIFRDCAVHCAENVRL